MSKMIFNGLEFVAGQEINNNGMFIDTDNVIVSETTYNGSFSYTAIQDCAVVVNFCGNGSASGWIVLDGVAIGRLYTTSGSGISGDTYFVKKGQTISATSQAISGVDLTYTVYGLQSGSISNVQHNYSTSEQLVGTWIDGKPLYEKTFTKSYSSLNGNATIDVTNDMPSDTEYVKAFEGTVTHDYSSVRDLHIGDRVIDFEKEGNTFYVYLHVGSSTLQNVDIIFTIQYTKTTD